MNGALHVLFWALFAGTCLVLGVAIVHRDTASVANALASLAVTLLSLVAASGFQVPPGEITLAPVLPLWVATAALLHSIGMLGPYDSVWWWDHLTHTVSAALAAALLYAAVVVAAGEGTSLALSRPGLAAVTVGYVAVLGVAWELLELVARAIGERYGVEPVLVHYGWRDTALDMVFDLLGAVLVVALDVRLFVGFVARYPAASRTLLVWTGAVALVGSAVMALGLSLRGQQRTLEV